MGRVRYIDLLKGLFIILMVMRHCDCVFETSLPGFEAALMPMFFALSGLFYKSYGSINSLVINKVNRILVPFAFFYITAYMLFYFMKFYMPDLLITEANGIADFLVQKRMFNDPIWYLLAIFWCYIYYAIIERLVLYFKVTKSVKTGILSLLVVMMAVLGKSLGDRQIFLPMCMDTALTAMPFFFFGVLLKGSTLIKPNRYDRFNLIWAALFYGVAFIISRNFDIRLVMSNNITSSYIIYPLAISSTLSMIFLTKAIGDIPPISYLGRNTMVILCLHQMVYRPLQVFMGMQPIELLRSPYMIAAITLVICVVTIPLFKKYLPQVIGEKDLINIRLREAKA